MYLTATDRQKGDRLTSSNGSFASTEHVNGLTTLVTCICRKKKTPLFFGVVVKIDSVHTVYRYVTVSSPDDIVTAASLVDNRNRSRVLQQFPIISKMHARGRKQWLHAIVG